MAARENQGYIIGIIILSILTVVLLLLTVLSTMKAYENHDNWTAADKVKSDVIAAPDPGFSVPIAIAGFIDLDGDGSSDLQKLIQQVRRNGGNVVASHDTDGNITGSIDATTRYFVQGPSGRTGVSYSGNASRASQKLNAQAKKFNVQQIDLRTLRNWMGQRLASNTQQLDGGLSTNSAEFPRRSRTGSGSKLLGGGASPDGSGSSNADGSGGR